MLNAERSQFDAGTEMKGGIQVKQRNTRMNLPAGTAIQGGGMAAAQFQRIARIGEELMRFADDDAVDADPSRQNPLLGAAFRRVGMLPQQPVQQWADLSFHRISNR
jgi:hypothetical protein